MSYRLLNRSHLGRFSPERIAREELLPSTIERFRRESRSLVADIVFEKDIVFNTTPVETFLGFLERRFIRDRADHDGRDDLWISEADAGLMGGMDGLHQLLVEREISTNDDKEPPTICLRHVILLLKIVLQNLRHKADKPIHKIIETLLAPLFEIKLPGLDFRNHLGIHPKKFVPNEVENTVIRSEKFEKRRRSALAFRLPDGISLPAILGLLNAEHAAIMKVVGHVLNRHRAVRAA